MSISFYVIGSQKENNKSVKLIGILSYETGRVYVQEIEEKDKNYLFVFMVKGDKFEIKL